MNTEKEISCWSRALYLSLEENPDNYEKIFANFKA